MVNWRSILGIAGTLAAIAFAFWVLDWHALRDAVARVPIQMLVGVATLSAAATLLPALRWAVLMAPARGPPDRIDVLHSLIGAAFNIITPAALGADAYRFAAAGGRPRGRSGAFGMLLVERCLGVFGYAFCFLVALGVAAAAGPVSPVLLGVSWIFFALAVGPLAVVVMLPILARSYPGWLEARQWHRTASMTRAFAALPSDRLASAVGLTLVTTMLWLVYVIIIAQGIGVALPAPVIAMIAVVTEFTRLLPISIQGIGVREVTFSWLVKDAGGAGEAAFVACAIAYALHSAVIAVMALIARALLGTKWRQGPRHANGTGS